MANWCSCTIVFDDPPEDVGTRLTKLIQEDPDWEFSDFWLTDIDSTETEMWFSIKWGISNQNILDLGNKLDLGGFVCTYEEGGMCSGGKYTYQPDKNAVGHQEVLELYWKDRTLACDEGWDIDMEDYFHVYSIWSVQLNNMVYDIGKNDLPDVRKALILTRIKLKENIE